MASVWILNNYFKNKSSFITFNQFSNSSFGGYQQTDIIQSIISKMRNMDYMVENNETSKCNCNKEFPNSIPKQNALIFFNSLEAIRWDLI